VTTQAGAQVIDGRACARSLKATLSADISRLRRDGLDIGLATIKIGSDYGADAYERRLHRLADELGVRHDSRSLPPESGESDALDLIEVLNADPTVSGILILRPVPSHIHEATLFRALDPRKDVEAVHPENAGLLAHGVPRFVPSTAASVFHLLDTWIASTGEDLADFYHRSLIVVVGRSNNVGKPAISLGYERQATVQSVDEWADRTTGLGRHTRAADILIVAAGKAGLIKAEHVNDHAVVIDVGINAATGPDGMVHMVGDVDFESVRARVRAITTVPGGVGPVTDVWLLHNTTIAARLLAGRQVPEAPVFTTGAQPSLLGVS